LICLGGDRDCIGIVVHVSASNLTGFADNDYSVNLLLQPNEFGADRATVEASTPYGYLVKAQDKITAAGLPTAGHKSKDEATGTVSEILHIEFEGGGAYAWLKGAEVGFVAAVAALILCVYLPPIPQLHTIITILGLLGLLVMLLGGLIGLGTSGSPSDAGTNVGELHTNTEPNNGQGAGADIIYVSGTWVYDPWHEGWNEIHPVKVCTKVGTWRGDWDTVGPDIILKVRTQFELATSAETLAAQKRPEHQWVVHPALDACAPVARRRAVCRVVTDTASEATADWWPEPSASRMNLLVRDLLCVGLLLADQRRQPLAQRLVRHDPCLLCADNDQILHRSGMTRCANERQAK
jgi:hypothetical protein